MSEFNMENETELQTKFLSEIDEITRGQMNNNEITHKPKITHKLNISLRSGHSLPRDNYMNWVANDLFYY